jgi:hypothetical protein
MSILDSSPSNNRFFSAEIAEALGDINAAVIVQQLHYWMGKERVGKTIDGVRWIFNSFNDWVLSQFKWLSVWQFRKSMNLLRNLGIVLVKRQKAKQWNQTNYYSLNYDRLFEFLKWQRSADLRTGFPLAKGTARARSTENSEMCNPTAQGEESLTLDLRNNDLSFKEAETTVCDLTTKQATDSSHSEETTSKNPFAVAPKKPTIKTNLNQQCKASAKLSSTDAQTNSKPVEANKKPVEDKKIVGVDVKINNKKWESHLKELETLGVPQNPTVVKMVKSHEAKEVENAIALIRNRKRDKHIPNPAGYFVQALKEKWQDLNVAMKDVSNLDKSDSKAVFRYWYDLAKELGHCSGQDIREDEQWVCIAGSWEKWLDAVNRGYTVEYLKKVLSRSKNA